MAWKDNPINGQQSVATNKTPINDNFQYIADSMQIDHFWDNANANLDGHHQFVQMPKNESGGSPANPSIATDVDGVMFSKQKTSTEATVVQNVEPYYISNDGTNDQVLQIGYRAIAVWDGNGTSAITQAKVKYTHNIKAQDAGTPSNSGIYRTDTGRFIITFNTDLPSENYYITGGAIRNTGSVGDNPMILYVPSDTTVTDVKSKSRCYVNFRNPDGSHHDALHYWLMVVGG